MGWNAFLLRGGRPGAPRLGRLPCCALLLCPEFPGRSRTQARSDHLKVSLANISAKRRSPSVRTTIQLNKMRPTSTLATLVLGLLAGVAVGQTGNVTSLLGTWSSGSGGVLTGSVSRIGWNKLGESTGGLDGYRAESCGEGRLKEGKWSGGGCGPVFGRSRVGWWVGGLGGSRGGQQEAKRTRLRFDLGSAWIHIESLHNYNQPIPHRGTAQLTTPSSPSSQAFADPMNAETPFAYPATPGIAYSFTEDGFFEESQFRYNSNGQSLPQAAYPCKRHPLTVPPPRSLPA